MKRLDSKNRTTNENLSETPVKNQIFILKNKNGMIISKTSDFLPENNKIQLLCLKKMGLLDNDKFIADETFTLSEFFSSSFQNPVLLQEFLNENKEFSPILRFIHSLLDNNLNEIMSLARENEPNALLFISLQNFLYGFEIQAMEFALLFFKNYGTFPLYQDKLISVSGLGVIGFLLENSENKSEMESLIKNDVLLGDVFLSFLKEILEGSENGEMKNNDKMEKNRANKSKKPSTLLKKESNQTAVNHETPPKNSEVSTKKIGDLENNVENQKDPLKAMESLKQITKQEEGVEKMKYPNDMETNKENPKSLKNIEETSVPPKKSKESNPQKEREKLGENNDNHKKDKEDNLHSKSFKKLIHMLENKKNMRNALFLSSELRLLFSFEEKNDQNKENLLYSIENFNHEMAKFKFFQIFLKGTTEPLHFFSVEYMNKWLFNDFLEDLCSQALTKGSEIETFRINFLSYLFGNMEFIPILFTLAFKRKLYNLCFEICEKMNKLGISGTFIKEAICLLKTGEMNENVASHLKNNLLKTEEFNFSVESRYIYGFSAYLLGKTLKDNRYYHVCLYIILKNCEEINVFLLYLLRKLTKIPESPYYNKKVLKKVERFLNNSTPEYFLDYALMKTKGQDMRAPDKKNSKGQFVNKVEKLLNVTSMQLRDKIVEEARTEKSIDAVVPIERKSDGFFSQLATKLLFSVESPVDEKAFMENFKEILTENRKNFMKNQESFKFTPDFLLDFINKTNLANGKCLENAKKSSAMVGFKNEDVKEIEQTIYEFKETKKQCIKIPAQNIFSQEEDLQFFKDFLTDFKGFFPFNLEIYGFVNDENNSNTGQENSDEEPSFTLNSSLLIQKSISSLEFIINNQKEQKYSNDFLLKLLVQLSFLCVSSNLTGLHGILFQKDAISLDENKNLKFSPLISLLAQKNSPNNFWESYLCPELLVKSPHEFSKIDSWILGLLGFKLIFQADYWDIYKEYLKSFGLLEESDPSFGSILKGKIQLFFRKKDEIPWVFLEKMLESLQEEEPKEKPIQKEEIKKEELENKSEKSENFEKSIDNSPGLASEMLSESIMSLPVTPLKPIKHHSNGKETIPNKPPIKSHYAYQKDEIKEIQNPQKNNKSPEKNQSPPLNWKSFQKFFLSLVHKTLSLEIEERISPLEFLFELHKYLRQVNRTKGIFEFIPESLLLNALYEKSEMSDPYALSLENPIVGPLKLSLTKKGKMIETDDFLVFSGDDGQGFCKSKILGIDFQGEMSGFLPKEGFLTHKILLPEIENGIKLGFEPGSWIYDKKMRNDMIYRSEKKGKDFEEFDDFNFLADEIIAHEGKPYLIDLFNNHYISDFHHDGTPIYFLNPVDKTCQPLIYMNLTTIFCYYKEKFLIYDAIKGFFTKIDAKFLGNKNKISIFEILEVFKNQSNVEIFAINGFKFKGKFINSDEKIIKMLGFLSFNSLKVEFLNEIPRTPLLCKILFLNGDVYEGEIIEGKYSGEGKYYYYGKYTFQGTFSNDIFVKGTITYHQPKDKILKYEGEVLHTPDNKSYLKHGIGKLTFLNGDFYEGAFENDYYHGKGVFYQNKEKCFYEGEFYKGKKQGQGVLKTVFGDCYTGSFKDDKRSGYGKEVYRSLDLYEGEFENGKKQGRGIYLCKKGYFQGEFKGDFKEGDGVVKTNNNEKFVVKYHKDKIIRKKKVEENRQKNEKNKKLTLV